MLAGQSLDLAQVRLVLQSVITQEYNYLLSWPISLVMRVLGTGRYVYLFAVANLYVMPALAGMAALARRVRRGGLLLACATPMLLYTGLTGFVDVAAAGAGIWALCGSTQTRAVPQAARGILTGALLTLVFLLRRYFFVFHRVLRAGGAAGPGGAPQSVEVLCRHGRLRRGVLPVLRAELPG